MQTPTPSTPRVAALAAVPGEPAGQVGPGRQFGRPVIEMQGVTKRFDEATAVENLSFTVHEGEIFGFIGPSGSGKTTTIRLMNGTFKADEGAARVFGEPAHHISLRTRERIGYLPQLFILYPNLSVKENIDFSASLYGMSWFGKRRRRRKEVLDFVELSDHQGKLARDISGGMQRRLALASSLIHDPDLIFLDEPTAGIDPILRAKFWDKFRALTTESVTPDGKPRKPKTLFVTTQYVTEAEYCDHVAVLGHGRIIAVDTPENLRSHAFGGEIVQVRSVQIGHATRPLFARVEGIRGIDTSVPGQARLVVDDASTAMPTILDLMRTENLEVEGMEQYRPNFDEVFVRLLERANEHIDPQEVIRG